MSILNLLVHGTLNANGAGYPDPAALVEPPEDRPLQDKDIVLDERLLPLMREDGVGWSTLLKTVEGEEDLPDASLLRWLSEVLHFQLVEEDPKKPGTWRLTPAGEQHLKELP